MSDVDRFTKNWFHAYQNLLIAAAPLVDLRRFFLTMPREQQEALLAQPRFADHKLALDRALVEAVNEWICTSNAVKSVKGQVLLMEERLNGSPTTR